MSGHDESKVRDHKKSYSVVYIFVVTVSMNPIYIYN